MNAGEKALCKQRGSKCLDYKTISKWAIDTTKRHVGKRSKNWSEAFRHMIWSAALNLWMGDAVAGGP